MRRRRVKKAAPKEEEPFIKKMRYREKRGTKISKLLKDESEEEEDEFWKDNNLFGKLEELSENDNDDYSEHFSQDKDSFDSDFYDSEKGEEETQEDSEKGTKPAEEVLESLEAKAQKQFKHSKHKKHKGEILDIENEVLKIAKKTEYERKKKAPRKVTTQEWRPKFIHEVYSQEQLLREAVAQEYLNRYSLSNLLALQESKKKSVVRGRSYKMLEGPVKWKSSLQGPNWVCSEAEINSWELLDAFYGKQGEECCLGKRCDTDGEIQKVDMVTHSKYTHPLTMSQFDTLEEYRNIEKLRKLEELRKIQSQTEVLEMFMGVRQKRLKQSGKEDRA